MKKELSATAGFLIALGSANAASPIIPETPPTPPPVTTGSSGFLGLSTEDMDWGLSIESRFSFERDDGSRAETTGRLTGIYRLGTWGSGGSVSLSGTLTETLITDPDLGNPSFNNPLLEFGLILQPPSINGIATPSIYLPATLIVDPESIFENVVPRELILRYPLPFVEDGFYTFGGVDFNGNGYSVGVGFQLLGKQENFSPGDVPTYRFDDFIVDVSVKPVPPTPVPEVSALAGLPAILGIALFEYRRRQTRVQTDRSCLR